MHAQLLCAHCAVCVRITFQLNNCIFSETMGTMLSLDNTDLNTIFENSSRLEQIIVEFDVAECRTISTESQRAQNISTFPIRSISLLAPNTLVIAT